MAKTLVALTIWLCFALPAVAAQQDKAGAKNPPVRPAWSELTQQQQQILAPLAAEWDNMDATRRKNWVGIAERYPKVKPAEQQRLQKNMEAWAKLTPEQRKAAREKYQTLQRLPPDGLTGAVSGASAVCGSGGAGGSDGEKSGRAASDFW